MSKKRNLNLIEILVVVAIIAVLGTISVNKLGSMQTRAKVTQTVADLNSISAAIINYKNEYGELPYTGNDYPTADMAVNFSDILPVLRGDNKRGLDFLNKDLESVFQAGDNKSYANYSFQIALDYDHSDTIDSGVFSGKTFPAHTQDILTSVSVWVKSPNEGNSDIYAWTGLDLNNANAVAAVANVDPNDGVLTEAEATPSDTKVKSNNGFGNNSDGIDTDNKNWQKKAKQAGWTDDEIAAKQAELDAGGGDTTEGR